MAEGPLTEDEIEWIDEVLSKYGTASSVIDMAELDGLLTGFLSLPAVTPADVLWQAAWGEANFPEWATESERQRFESLVLQHQADIAERLEYYPTQFEPMFGTEEVDNREIVLVEEWCYGYMRAISMANKIAIIEALQPSLAAIALHGVEENINNINMLSAEDYLQSLDEIKPAVLRLYTYWHHNSAGQALH